MARLDRVREASGSVRSAINEVGGLEGEVDAALVREAREQLLAAMHLIDGVGIALRRSGL
jgi:hypothetical protein